MIGKNNAKLDAPDAPMRLEAESRQCLRKDMVFCDFAFEVVLAVCGWDIDDSSFADHPYYPADLVRYYRENVRHSRDA